jgi:hypothetical protein
LLRDVKSLTRAANEALGEVMAGAARAEAHAAALSGHVERLQAAVERLQVAQARLAVLTAAAGSVKRSLDGVRGAVPRK